MSIYANTTASSHTHFIAATELIREARDRFHVCSENWPYPMDYRFGDPRDRYYAEIWLDGMDWQNSYWLIETVRYGSPVCVPLIIFEDHKNRDAFSEYDFAHLVRAVMNYRRDVQWLKQGPDSWHNDDVWPFLHRGNEARCPGAVKEGVPGMAHFMFEHASQPAIEFWMNIHCVPEEKGGEPYADARNNV